MSNFVELSNIVELVELCRIMSNFVELCRLVEFCRTRRTLSNFVELCRTLSNPVVGGGLSRLLVDNAIAKLCFQNTSYSVL